ncbi:cell number regulator 13-like [Phragmites australis]|uniref:cell number regulator 13-like n=1 Tax=Phragmites australis TaxID=29695 RepID=UPI002D78393A|nr:cell number regulator 13-like [Phragmites australis]XP_062188692.1 cell number regulator 13-like [Phragmites australis]XP_062188693.1 cell number regulator 13-like [Phragmites australis]XP_062188694.1 cell number regulator 13-like [Phragmites australis]
MALWNGLANAATVAQVAGVESAGLISVITQAVRTAKRNKKDCRRLLRRVTMIGDLLKQLQDSEMMRRPEIRKPLEGLDDTLRQAYELVASCQKSNVVYRIYAAGNQAERFREIENRIDSYLLLYPVISHIDVTRRLERIWSGIGLLGVVFGCICSLIGVLNMVRVNRVPSNHALRGP